MGDERVNGAVTSSMAGKLLGVRDITSVIQFEVIDEPLNSVPVI